MRGGPGIKAIPELLIAHDGNQLPDLLQFSRRAIHAEDHLALARQQSHLLRATGQRGKIREGEVRRSLTPAR